MRRFWFGHRRLYRLTRGRPGLWRPGRKGWVRCVSPPPAAAAESPPPWVGYVEDGPDLVVLAMNGWGAGEPAWRLNLQADVDAHVDHPDGPREVCARAATGDERDRLWARWREIGKGLDEYAARRGGETAVVVLEPRDPLRGEDGTAAGRATSDNASREG
jgi:F420H(2)-dependent quinone reductase